MYKYRHLTPQQQKELVQQRLLLGFPPHSPPHQIREENFYLLTAACYEHQHHMELQFRRQQLLNKIFEQYIINGLEISAWSILPNHYHLLVYVNDFNLLSNIFRLVHGSTSYQWNKEDKVRNRKVWYSYSDRAIRSERHYYTTLNYIHYNAVRHDWVESPYEWSESSVSWYLENYGRQWLRDCWVNYPVKDFGVAWDNF